MAFEIEFLSVGQGEKSGDAIVIRWSENNILKLGIIDGGTKDSGRAIVDHIRKYYSENSIVDFVLNTHPDSDHCSGLTVILEELKVRELWMHLPWDYSEDLIHWIEDNRITGASLENRLREKLAMAHELEKLAKRKGIRIFEPYQGQKVGPFTILSPSLEWYKTLISSFRNMPASRNQPSGFLNKAMDAIKQIAESFDIETLREGGMTSSENESSVILYGNFDGHKVMLTGDAGIQALSQAADFAVMSQV